MWFRSQLPDRSGLLLGSTTVLCLWATPGDQVREVPRGIQVAIHDQIAVVACVNTLAEGQLGFHHRTVTIQVAERRAWVDLGCDWCCWWGARVGCG